VVLAISLREGGEIPQETWGQQVCLFLWKKSVGFGAEIKLKIQIVKIDSASHPPSRHYF
jgi:hypothetical protein